MGGACNGTEVSLCITKQHPSLSLSHKNNQNNPYDIGIRGQNVKKMQNDKSGTLVYSGTYRVTKGAVSSNC